MTFGHEGGYAFNEEQRGGHDDAGAPYGAMRGVILRNETSEHGLVWLDRLWGEVQRLRKQTGAMPDLLAACEAAYSLIGPQYLGLSLEVSQQLRAAIQKARGG